jgi:inner membrane protease subunit 1
MFPTMEPSGDVVLVRRVSRANPTANLTHGDIVSASSPTRPRTYICKRILGFEGDVIWADPTGEAGIRPTEWVRVPQGHVWLAGDNPANSTDSRNYGPVSVNLLRGKVVARVRALSGSRRSL